MTTDVLTRMLEYKSAKEIWEKIKEVYTEDKHKKDSALMATDGKEGANSAVVCLSDLKENLHTYSIENLVLITATLIEGYEKVNAEKEKLTEDLNELRVRCKSLEKKRLNLKKSMHL